MTDRTPAQSTGADAAQAVGAEGPEELRRQIERTRSRLGDTVEELAGKMDVKGRARARAADLRDKAGAMTVQLRSTAAQAGHTVHDKATQAGHKVHGRATGTSHELERRAQRSVPAPARSLVMTAVRRPRPVLIVGAAVAVVVVVAWRYPRK